MSKLLIIIMTIIACFSSASPLVSITPDIVATKDGYEVYYEHRDGEYTEFFVSDSNAMTEWRG